MSSNIRLLVFFIQSIYCIRFTCLNTIVKILPFIYPKHNILKHLTPTDTKRLCSALASRYILSVSCMFSLCFTEHGSYLWELLNQLKLLCLIKYLLILVVLIFFVFFIKMKTKKVTTFHIWKLKTIITN